MITRKTSETGGVDTAVAFFLFTVPTNAHNYPPDRPKKLLK